MRTQVGMVGAGPAGLLLSQLLHRAGIESVVLESRDRRYPFAWLGVLAQAPPTHDELIYAYHDCGFAQYSMRSPEITRLYLQVAPDEDMQLWSEQRIWDELHTQLETEDGWKLIEGPVLEKGITGMRSHVVGSQAAAASLAENYVGLPFAD
ncbi:MAG: FAD-dependent monooxygenase [Burkholderiales bacterium]|nr:FAD-dependent monooxygenase [Burkholderiales bacterium]